MVALPKKTLDALRRKNERAAAYKSQQTQSPLPETETAPPLPEPDEVKALRGRIWDAGYRPVAIYNWNSKIEPEENRGKRPVGDRWQVHARRDPPVAATAEPWPTALNTGILADGLRPVDLDIDESEVSVAVRQLAEEMLGPAPVRGRANSARVLMLYRAAEGSPHKRTLTGRGHSKERACKIEILGHRNQFVSHGIHLSKEPIYWQPRFPEETPRDSLTAVTEEQITEFLLRAAELIDADPSKVTEAPSGGKAGAGEAGPGFGDETRNGAGPGAADSYGDEPDNGRAPIEDVAAALAVIPNNGAPDWEFMNEVGMAAWRATGGLEVGFLAWSFWCAKNPSYNPKVCVERWKHYFDSPPTRTGACKLFAMASKANGGFITPSGHADRRGADNGGGDDGIPILSFQEVLRLPPPIWLLRPLLVENTFAVVYGPPASLKSFIVLCMALTLATGGEWCGKRVRRRDVLYVCAEGAGGVRKRLAAWAEVHDMEPDAEIPGIRVVPIPVDLTKQDKATNLINRILKEQRCNGFDPDLIIIDTLARCAPGADENSAKDMGLVISNGTMIQASLGCALLAVHHTGKDPEKGMRGSSALTGAADTGLLVVRTEHSLTTKMFVEKQKDAEDGFEMVFNARVVDLPFLDEDGEPETSLVVRPEGVGRGRPKQPTDQAGKAFKLLKGLAQEPSAPFHPDDKAIRCCHTDMWRKACKGQLSDSDKRNSHTVAFNRARKELLQCGFIQEEGNLVWIIKEMSPSD